MLVHMRISLLSLILVVFWAGSVNADSELSAEEPNLTGITLVINELMASNNYIRDPQDESDDWIEIHNYGSSDIDIGGMYLTDDLNAPSKWRIPASTTIQAGGYLLIWADNDTADTGLHANFKLDADGEEIGLFDRDGIRPIDSITFPDQTTDVSYGRYPDANDNWRFFGFPSPAAQNEGGYLGEVADTKLSHDRGFYNTPFSVTISTETEDADIYYTLDGSEPYLSGVRGTIVGTVYTGPIPINTTTCLRAKAVKDGWKSTEVDTQTYIFVNDVITQTQEQATDAGFPASWGWFPADYEMDPDIYNDPDYSGQMADALFSLPTLSIVTDMEYLFHPSVGIYMNPLEEGDDLAWEWPTSAELFCPDGSKEFQINCGLRIQGGHSRHPYKSPKHAFSLRFRNIYGPPTLDYKLFGDDWPVDSFDTLHLRAGFNDAWIHRINSQNLHAQYIYDPWMRKSLTEMGNPDALQGFFVHLYLNGLYWGIYHLHERPDADHYAAYNGGDADNIDAINGDPDYVQQGDPLNTGSVSDGTKEAWHELKDIVASLDWEQICEQLDVDNFIDWTILTYFAGTTDIKYGTNWRAAGGGPQRRPWRFYCWDAEHVMERVRQDWIGNVSDPSRLIRYLEDIEEFHVRFGDRVHKHLFNNGALTTERNLDRWIKLSEEVQLAVIAESARWGDYRRDVHSFSPPYPLYTKNDHWIPQNNYIINEYFPYRKEFALNMFRDRGMYPFTDAPVFHINGSYQHGGQVAHNSLLSMTVNTGTVYYTLDDTDPRQSGGAVSPAALNYTVTGPVTKSG